MKLNRIELIMLSEALRNFASQAKDELEWWGAYAPYVALKEKIDQELELVGGLPKTEGI